MNSPLASAFRPLPALSAYTVKTLGSERARLAEKLRERLWSAGLRWPHWIDARPGRLAAVIGDCIDPPLGLTRAYLLQHHASLIVEGLGALGLALAAPRLALAINDGTAAPKLTSDAVELCRMTPVFPPQPSRAIANLEGTPWSVPVETLVRAGATLRGISPPRVLSVVGAVNTPKALPVEAQKELTPRQLVRLAGGALPAAWVALRNDPLGGEVFLPDQPLPADTSVIYVLSVRHPLVRRQKMATEKRARATCLDCRLCTDFCPEAAHGTAPHEILHALARRELGPSSVTAARGCTGCGACSVICPAGLLPGALTFALSAAEPRRDRDEPPKMSAKSQLPLELALRRLDLQKFTE